MSFRILTPCVAGIDSLVHDPHKVLNNTKEGIVAIFINNTPSFYAISEHRLAQLLELETYFLYSSNNRKLNKKLYEKSKKFSISIPINRFIMFPEWKPDTDFQKIAALWGIFLKYPVTSEELEIFTTYWSAEKKAYYHIQWQQKLARSIQTSRNNIIKNNQSKRRSDINAIAEPNNQIPPGFRG